MSPPSSSTDARPDPRDGAAPSALALGLWVGLALAAGRAAVIFAMDHLAHGLELHTSLWRLGRELDGVTARGVVAGLVAVALAWVGARTGSGRAARAFRFALAGVALAGWLALALSGAGVDQASRVPGLDTERGEQAWIALAAAGVVGALGLLLVLRSARTLPRPVARSLSGLRGVAVPLVLALVAPFALRAVLGGTPPRMVLTEVARALLEGEPTWEVVREHPAGPPEPGVILPVVDWRVEGGERPSLVMPPGSEVVFTVEEDEGEVVLRTAAGIDQGLVREMRKGWPPLRFRFTVDVNGELVFDETLSISREMEPRENHWHAVGGTDGLALEPGDVVRLATAMAGPTDRREITSRPWRIGFSTLVLERTREKARALSSPDEPNLVLILMDTQRYDRLGAYGYERDVSPNLDRLAERGTLFEEAYATSSWTWPSTASVLSGLQAEEHGVTDGSSCYLARSVELLPEVLQRNGYTTACFSGSPLIVPAKNFGQGFETVDHAPGFRKSDLVVPNVLDWIRMNAGTRFFAYVHLVDPHAPHTPLPEALEALAGPRPEDLPDGAFNAYTWEFRRGRGFTADGEPVPERVAPPEHVRWLSDVYDACVWTGDHWVGRIVDLVDELGLAEETVFAFTSDHGEEFLDHGMLEHAHSVFGELVRVPLILAGPGVPAGVRSDVPVSNRHLAPTLARLGGVRLEHVVDGVDLARPSELEPAPVVFGTLHGWWNNWYRTRLDGMRDGDWVVHFAPEAGDWGADEPAEGGDWRLYRLDAEGREAEAGDPEAAERARALVERLQAELETIRGRRTVFRMEAGEETESMLEGIGYLDSGEQ